MDYRLFIVSLPFLVCLLFTLTILIYDEYLYYKSESCKDNIILETKNRYLYKLIIYTNPGDINIVKLISNTLFLSSIIFILLLLINRYIQ